MELVKHPVEELLAVVLRISLEHGVSLPDCLFEPIGRKAMGLLLVPELVEELAEPSDDLTLGAHHVVKVDLRLEGLTEEESSENVEVAEALEGAVHVARVAQVCKALTTLGGHGVNNREIYGVHIDAVQVLAGLHVVVLVGLAALRVAVVYLAAGTLGFQDPFVEAVLALPQHRLALVVFEEKFRVGG